MKFVMKKALLVLVLLPLTSQSAEIAMAQSTTTIMPYWDIIKKISTVAAATFIPGYLWYKFPTILKPEDERKLAQDTLSGYYNRTRAFTVEEINKALKISKMNDEELQEYLDNQKRDFGTIVGVICGLLYYVAKYKPFSPSTSTVRYSRLYMPPIPKRFAAACPY